MTKKEYLRQGYKIRQEIKIQEDVLKELHEGLDNLKSFDYSKDRVQGGLFNDDTLLLNKINDILTVEENISKKTLELKTIQKNLYIQITLLADENEKRLLIARYILNETWERIAERLGYSVMHTHRIHKRALEHFEFF